MPTQRTLVLIKPDGVQRGLIGPILGRLERRGLKLIGLKLIQVDDALARRHYAEHLEKPFFASLHGFITSSPLVAAAFEDERAVQIVRAAMGSTDPADAAPGTIRGDFAVDLGRNVIHGSDSPESGEREVALFFSEDELLDWSRGAEPWIRE